MAQILSKNLKNIILCLSVAATTIAGNFSYAELAVDPIPNVATLTLPYPPSLIFVQDMNFDSMIAGRVVLIDVAHDNHNYLGALDASKVASFIQSATQDELYVAETFYSRGTRGERTDVLTIYDKKNLKPIDEIILPGAKRGLMMTNRYTMQLVDKDRFLFLFNFTPASSVVMIDTKLRKILSETPIPACSLIYPTGLRGFSSLCADGSMFTAQFNEAGVVTSKKTIPSFFSVDDDPLFDTPVYIKGTAYFPSFLGQMQAIGLKTDTPIVETTWSLLSEAERKEKWRPGGLQLASASNSGLIYILMHRDGYNGSHKSPGSEVWVFNPANKKRVKRFKLKEPGVSIEVTGGEKPYLVVTNEKMQLDVYSAGSGQWLKVIGKAAATPFGLQALR